MMAIAAPPRLRFACPTERLAVKSSNGVEGVGVVRGKLLDALKSLDEILESSSIGSVVVSGFNFLQRLSLLDMKGSRNEER